MKSLRSTDRLERAMDVFWERGYYDTSMSELMGRTGLHRAAVYGAFGSKLPSPTSSGSSADSIRARPHPGSVWVVS